jgi:hypothetical protein
MTLLRHASKSPAEGGAPRRAAATGAAIIAAGALATGFAAAAPAIASTHVPAVHYTFKTIDNSNDLTFNQLLGINNAGVIAGYFGTGAQFHPNKGYRLLPPYRQSDFRVENYPNSAQTQVTGLNDTGITVGFYSHTNTKSGVNANFGFYAVNGRHFRAVNFPTTNNSTPPVNQLLGVNDSGIAVGFYNNSKGLARSYEYNTKTHKFRTIGVPGDFSITASAINNHGGVAGFFTTSVTSPVRSFFINRSGRVYVFAWHGASMTQAFGVNDSGEVVGAYTIGTSTFGFTWAPGKGFHTVNDPRGIGTTLINGVNDAGDLVGFYTGKGTHVNGFLAKP